MKYGRILTAFLSAAVLVAALGGCGRKDTKDSSVPELQKGKWVETKEELPEALEGWELQGIFSAGDGIHLLASRKEDKSIVLSEWAKQDDAYSEVTRDWLSSIALPGDDWLDVTLLQDGSGTQYLYAGYTAEDEEDYKGHLWKEEGGQAKDITPQKWTVPDADWGIYERQLGTALLEDGTLFTLSYTSMDILSGEDGSVLASEPLNSQYEEIVISDGEAVYLCAQTESGARIEKRAGGKGSADTFALPSDSSGSLLLCVDKDGALVAAGSDGIFRCEAGQESWEKLLDGVETDFAMTGCWGVDLAAADGDIYALFRESEGGARLNHYAFDPDAVIEITEELKLYTVYESSLLQQAAVMYHREHPEVLITIEYAYPAYYYDETDYNAVYQNLNTMLMGDEAPDILVMDYLDMDSFIEKGLLADIGGVVDPLEESGALLSNITGSYVREDGHRYVVPLQFGFNMALGRDIGEGDMASLEALADFLAKSGESYMGPQTVSELVDKFYPYFCGEIIDGKQLNREALGEKLECLKVIADNCGMIETREKGERSYNMWELASQAKLAFNESMGFKDCMFPIAMADYIKGSFTAYNHSFIPFLQTGICTKSPYQDTAMDFLKLALSESVQNTDYYKGFPVNLASLEKQSHEDRSEAEAYTSIEAEGQEVEFVIKCYSDETADKIVALCRTLDQPRKEDAKIREVLIEALGGYLTGAETRETAVQRVEDGLKMYLAE